MESFFASSPRGLEPLLGTELASLGAKLMQEVPGGVAFSGDWSVCYRANLWSRLASRILWRVAEFDYAGEDDLYEAARKVDWLRLFAVERTLRVNVSAQNSTFPSIYMKRRQRVSSVPISKISARDNTKVSKLKLNPIRTAPPILDPRNLAQPEPLSSVRAIR